MGQLRHFCIFFWAENYLRYPLAVAQVGKDHAAMVTGRIHPSDQGYGLIDVRKAELIAMMCAHDSFGGRVLKTEFEKKSMDFCFKSRHRAEIEASCSIDQATSSFVPPFPAAQAHEDA